VALFLIVANELVPRVKKIALLLEVESMLAAAAIENRPDGLVVAVATFVTINAEAAVEVIAVPKDPCRPPAPPKLTTGNELIELVTNVGFVPFTVVAWLLSWL
jgi:hypothetical protein